MRHSPHLLLPFVCQHLQVLVCILKKGPHKWFALVLLQAQHKQNQWLTVCAETARAFKQILLKIQH